jgi:hypothetical protein
MKTTAQTATAATRSDPDVMTDLLLIMIFLLFSD